MPLLRMLKQPKKQMRSGWGRSPKQTELWTTMWSEHPLHSWAHTTENVVFRFISSSASEKPHSIFLTQQSRRNVVPFLFESVDEILSGGRPWRLSI